MAAITKIGTLMNDMLGLASLELMKKCNSEKLRQNKQRYHLLLRRLAVEDESILFEPRIRESRLPDGAQSYLRRDNPRLQELERRYASVRHPVLDHSRWTNEFVASDEIDLQHFRGDTYVWQHRDLNFEVHYLVTTNYIRSIDELALLRSLEEDGLFGAYTVSVGDLIVSRDLLDSIAEIYFLHRTLGITGRANLRILDIGAGYGRLAHRLVRAFASVGKIICVDPVAVSTFLSEYYLRFRGVNDRTAVVPFDQMDEALAGSAIDLAVNCHSFSECTLASIKAWLEILNRREVRYLMIVPSPAGHGGKKLLTLEKDGSTIDYLPALQANGWKLVACDPKYLDPLVQRHGITPTHHYLFERGEAGRG